MAELQHSNGDMIVWYIQLAEFQEDLLEDTSRRILAADELERANQYRFERDKASFLAGTLLTRLQLAEITGTPVDVLQFETNQFGKPHLLHPADTRIQFSRSRTKAMVANAVSCLSCIGLDIERIDPTVEVESIADQFFATAEVDQLQQSPAEIRQELFFRIWTLKEAYVKACGEGLSIPLDRFSFDLSEDTPRISFSASLDDDPGRWQFVESSLGQRHRAAVAFRGETETTSKIEWIDKTQHLIHSVTFPT